MENYSNSQYLKGLKIKNIKCFGPEQYLDFTRNGGIAMWNMILGENGTGKSTLLQSIVAVIMRSKLVILDSFEKPNEAQVILENEEKLSFSLASVGSYILSSDTVNVTLPIMAYGGVRKISYSGLSESNKLGYVESIFHDDSKLINAEDWFLRSDYDKLKSKNKIDQVALVKKLLLDILKGEITDIRVNEDKTPYRVEFQTPYGWVYLRQLSTGYRSLISWMVDLSYHLSQCYPKSKNPHHEKAIVLVDDIDLHLHVELQRRLVQFLRSTFPKIQFIVTAHSPLVAQSSEGENLAVLQKNGDHVIINNEPADITNRRIDQILTSDLFGLASARSLQTQSQLDRRKELLTKDQLEIKEGKEMQDLESFAVNTFARDNPTLSEAEELIKSVSKELKRIKK